MPILKRQSHYCPIILRSSFDHPSFILRLKGGGWLMGLRRIKNGINTPQTTELKSTNYGKIIHILRNFQGILCYSTNYLYLCTHVIKAYKGFTIGTATDLNVTLSYIWETANMGLLKDGIYVVPISSLGDWQDYHISRYILL